MKLEVTAAILLVVLTLVGRRALGTESRDQPRAEGTEAAAPGPERTVHIDAAAAQLIGLQFTTVQVSRQMDRIKARGVVGENPNESFTLRAPVAGFLVADGTWPELGAQRKSGALVGGVRPRVGPLEQINLAQQASDAAAAVDELEAELSAASASFESKRALSQEGQMVAQRAVDEAEARVKTARARLAGARRKLDGLRDAEHATDVGLTPLPLKITRGGQVVEVLAAPGEAVESGQPLMRVTNLEHLTANIELPAGETWNPTDAPVTLTLPAREDARCTAHVATQGPRAGVTTRGESWRLAIEQNPAQIRPGAPLVAYLPRNGEPLEGVVVPRRALVRHGGLAWVYVRRADTVFERREVDLAFPMSDGWFATSGLVSGDQVVTVGAQELLSEQLKEQIEREEEAAE